ncbi:putative chromatin regulator PHD family [Dioscorea sansibarensis]
MAAQPSPKKRPRPSADDQDLKKVAEIVMVLSAMADMRAGAPATAVEKSLVAEAREKLVRACEDARPRDLFSREAVRVLVEDLGLNRSRDPLLGFRPPKMSIAEKLLLTKRKMEESKEVVSHSSANAIQFQPVGFHASSDGNNTLFHGAPRFLPDKPSPSPYSAGGAQTASPMVPVPTAGSASSSSKLLQMSAMHPVVTPAKSSTGSTPFATTSHAEVTHFRLDPRSNGSPYLTRVRATTDCLPEKSSTLSAHSAPNPALRFGQTNKLQDASTVKQEAVHEVNGIQTSVPVIADQDFKGSTVQATSGNLFVGHQHSGLTYVHPPSGFPSHNDIAQIVQRTLQNKTSERSNWTPPSTEYVNKGLSCQICKVTITDVESLLVCDSCEKGTHLKCLQSYGNKGISKLEWHCPKCLISSNGKPLPPKYGRVTRSPAPAVSKAPSSISGSQASTERKPEISDSKTNHQIPNGNSSFLVHASTTGGNVGDAVPIMKTDETKEKQDMGFAIRTKMEDGMCIGATSDHSKEVNGKGCVNPCPDSTCPDENIETTRSSPSKTHKPNSESMLQMKGEDSSNPHDEIIEPDDINCASGSNGITSQSLAVCDSQVDNKLDVPINFEGSADLLHEASKANIDESEKPSKSSELSIVNADSEKSKDEVDANKETPSEALSNGDVAGVCVTPVSGPSTIDWVGDILEVAEEKNYYQACLIKGAVHKLQDHVMVSSNSQKAYPSKIQNLWEDNKTGLTLATVIPYYFPADIPEAVSCPSTPVDHEVYASNKENTIMVQEILGTCEVLPLHKFKEECNRSSNLQATDNSSHPIFFCKYSPFS